jgi:hypothetical protein
MAELTRPSGYADRLTYAQRLAKSAQFRTDPKLAVRELCEAIAEMTTALLEREQKTQSGSATPAKPSGA